MNPVEKFFMLVAYKITRMATWLKVLIVLLIISVIATIAVAQTGFFNTLGMSAEEKAAYEQQQAAIASAESAERAAQELIEQEKADGYKRYSSPNLTNEEAACVDFIKACQNGEMDKVATYLDVPNVFDQDNFQKWCNKAGISVFFNYDDDNRVVTVGDEDVLDEEGKEVIGTARVVSTWYANATSMTKFYITASAESPYGFVLTPKGDGILTNVVYDFPVRSITSESGDDLSAYATEAISAPISSSNGKGNLESNSSWYSFTFPKFPDVEAPHFYLNTDFGTFKSTTIVSEKNKDIAGIVIADFSDEEIEELNQSAAQAIISAVQAIQNGESDEVIASYLAVSDIVGELAGEKRDEEMFAGVSLITGAEVQRNELTSGYIPVEYNYHLVGSNTVSMDANIRFTLSSGGECRRCATILLRKIGDHWSVVATDKNFLDNINSLDPEW